MLILCIFFILIGSNLRYRIVGGGDDMDITLREWNLNVIVIESCVNAFHNLSVIAILSENIHPDENLQSYAIIIKALQYHLHTTSVVNATEL